jgi:hypothetical protein
MTAPMRTGDLRVALPAGNDFVVEWELPLASGDEIVIRETADEAACRGRPLPPPYAHRQLVLDGPGPPRRPAVLSV